MPEPEQAPAEIQDEGPESDWESDSPDDDEFLWAKDVDISGLKLDWNNDGGEWIGHIAQCLTGGEGNFRCSPYGGSLRYPGLILAVKGEPTRLVLVPSSRGRLQATVRGYESSGEPEAILRWEAAMDEGRRTIAAQPLIEWAAVISVHPQIGFQAQNQRVDRSFTVADMQLEPLPEPLVRSISRNYTMSSSLVADTWPVVVRGASRGSDIFEASRPAKSQLRRLCAVLSAGWGTCWTLVDGPHEADGFVPRTRDPSGKPVSDDDYGAEGGSVWEPVSPPTWFTDGYNLLAAEPLLLQASITYHEGLLLSEYHQSVALVCFTSAIEALGQRRFGPLPRCPECHSHVGTTSRFREMLAVVAGSNTNTSLVAAYGKRSTAVHEARLHGTEHGFDDAPYADFHLPFPARDFAFDVYQLERAARELLVQELSHS